MQHKTTPVADQELQKLLNCGFILLDKPRGPSSHEISAYIKKLLGLKKAGHSGTLDPKVSGVLIIGLNKATRLLRFLTMQSKTYIGVMRVCNKPKDLKEVQEIFKKFIGKIKQIPPKESAVAKKERIREIYNLEALEIEGKKILFRAKVQAGVYIRTLAEDIGKYFGCGKLLELRRIAVGLVEEEDCCNLYDLIDAWKFYKQTLNSEPIKRLIKPFDKIILLPKIYVEQKSVEAVCRGLPLAKSGVAAAKDFFAKNSYVFLVDSTGEIFAIGLSVCSTQDLKNLKNNSIVALPKIVLKNAEVA
ncbi:MAG: RNA-guided pseudouridylation complex pseudouridine synthase subunit Cbf5 [Candidatus Anstonellaceae archaeon]